ncbi:MAG: hypothetical protein ACYTHM_08815 [Planctomycetota bacterium]|jgi:hypothetical protein
MKKETGAVSFKETVVNRIIFVAYNVVWWIPVPFPFIGVISYKSGFILVAAITSFRLIANVFRVNVLSLERAVSFPFRIP